MSPRPPKTPTHTLWACAFTIATLSALSALTPHAASAADLIECTPGSFGTQLLNGTDDASFLVDATRVAAIFPGGIPLINNYNVMYINSNGNMTFQSGFTAFTPDGFPGLAQPTIGPFFADVDLRPAATDRGLYLCEDVANKRFIITWKDVGYYNQQTNKLNSFQAILTDTNDENPCTIPTMQVEFRYNRLEWTAGSFSSSGGVNGIWVGPSGAPAAAGIDAGDNTNIIELPNSKTNEVLDLVNLTNVGEPGVFRYTVVQGTFPVCGNGAVELCEQCDDTNSDNSDACTNLCLDNTCGDGFVHAGVEACDGTAFDGTPTCPAGFTGTPLCSNDPANPAGDGTCTLDIGSCADIDECALDTDTCDANASCTNTPGGFICACDVGYAGDGTTCTDIDECADGTDTCADDATCTNTTGGFSCACNAGYTGDGTTCTDIDECAANPTLCAPGTCTNNAGGYTCACPSGYTFDGTTCTDADECAANPTVCGAGACVNSGGGYTCTCPAGYTFDGTTCADIDECAANPTVCGAGACANTTGGFTCACDEGYTFNAVTCVDLDACDPNPCFTGVACTDEAPPSVGFTCGACPEGFTGDGVTCAAIVGNVAITAPAEGDVTNARRPVLTGTADPGEEVTITVDGQVVGTATADANGDWTFALTDALADGAHRLEASVTDDEGNTATVGVNVTVDTVAPWVIVNAPASGADLTQPVTAISGESEPNTTITVYVNGEAVGTTTTDANGDWTLTLPTPTEDGAYTVRVVAQDEAGNQGQEVVTFDVITDAAVTITQPAADATVRTGSPVVSGVGTPGAELTIYVNGEEAGTVTVDQDGTWTWTPTTPIAEGAATVRAVATVDGAEVGEATVSFTVDLTTAGVTVTQPAADSVIKDDTPTFSGTAEPGSEVVILDADGNAVGTVTADANGTWTWTPTDGFTDGTQTFTIQATDGDGVVSTATVTVTIDTIPPTLDVTSPTVGEVIEGSPVVVSGTAEPGAVVNVYVDGVLVATVTADANGDWSVTLSDDPENGPRNIRVVAEDEAGNATVIERDVTVDIAPVVEDIGDTSGGDTSGGDTSGADTSGAEDTSTAGDTSSGEDTSGAPDGQSEDTSSADTEADTQRAPAQLVGGAECGCSSVRAEQRGAAPLSALGLLVGFALAVAARRRRA